MEYPTGPISEEVLGFQHFGFKVGGTGRGVSLPTKLLAFTKCPKWSEKQPVKLVKPAKYFEHGLERPPPALAS